MVLRLGWYNSNWQNDSSYINTFNDNLIVSSVSQNWVDSTWVNAEKDSFNYDENRNQIESLH